MNAAQTGLTSRLDTVPPLTAPKFHFRAVPFCPVAQRVMVALAARGTHWTIDEVPGDVSDRPDLPQLVVISPDGTHRNVDKSIAMVEAVELAHPDQPLYPADPDERNRSAP